jgi:hypothetical protein
MEQAVLLRVVAAVLLFATLQGCSQSQQVRHPPCALGNVAVQVKPPANLSLIFGNDGIQAAVDSMTREVAQQGNASTSSLTQMGTDAAFNTAGAKGKNLTAQDKTAIEAYLREDVVPTITRNPTCAFTVSAASKPDIAVEDVYLEDIGGRQIAKVKIANAGQGKPHFVHVDVWNVIEGMNTLTGQTEMVLVPGQWRNVSNPQAPVPISAIRSGKKKLTIVVQFSYVIEVGQPPLVYREEWDYDFLSDTFKRSPMK